MKIIIYVLAIILLLAISGCTQTLTTTFLWTASGDDSSNGTATVYEMVMATDSISLTDGSGIQITGLPVPSIVGTAESFTTDITVQSETRYYFAIRVQDNAGNWSEWSNIATRYIPDIIPPMMIIDFRIP